MSLAAYIYPPEGGWDKKVLNTIRSTIALTGPSWTLTGKPILFDEIKSSIIWGSTLATIATLLMNILVIYWFFRKSRYVLLVMLPVTLGFLLTLGIMGLLKIPFNFMNVGTVSLIFGLGVDYGVYVMQAYLGEEKRDVSNALRITGKNVMMCAATTVAGCGSLITAKFIGISTIGFVLTIGTISCAAIALLFLPAILYLNEGRFQNERF
jgi:predicted RND superfamily exporter protein